MSNSNTKKSESKKPTVQEIEKLKREVYAQNRKLVLICAGILVFAVLILFSASNIAKWLTPTPWSYDNAVSEVFDGTQTANQYMYNNIVFARQSNESLWLFQGNIRNVLYEISMYYSPREVFDIKSSSAAFAQIYNKPTVVLALDAGLDLVPTGAAHGAIAAIELGKVIGTKNNILNKKTAAAVTRANPNIEVPLVFSCANATDAVGVIQLQIGDKTLVFAKKNCVIIQGSDPRELIRAADRFVYSLLGIIPLNVSPINVSANSIAPASAQENAEFALNDVIVNESLPVN